MNIIPEFVQDLGTELEFLSEVELDVEGSGGQAVSQKQTKVIKGLLFSTYLSDKWVYKEAEWNSLFWR